MNNRFEIDVAANRAATNYSGREQIARGLWALALPLFRLSPRPLWGWRRWLLRRFGARIGPFVHIYPTARITMPWHLDIAEAAAIGDRAILYCLGRVTIRSRATVSQGAHLCAGSHDLSRSERPLIKTPIVIGADVWIAADAFIGPNVTVHDGAVVGARAVVMKDVPSMQIVAGNPARPIGRVNERLARD